MWLAPTDIGPKASQSRASRAWWAQFLADRVFRKKGSLDWVFQEGSFADMTTNDRRHHITHVIGSTGPVELVSNIECAYTLRDVMEAVTKAERAVGLKLEQLVPLPLTPFMASGEMSS